MKLSDNTILITGGTSGIGLALAKALKAQNQVIVMGRNLEKLNQLKNQGFDVIQCDLKELHEIERACVEIQNRFPTLNLLFNNAGIQHNYDFTEAVMPLDKISEEIVVNVTGQIILTQLLIPVLSNNQDAFIINTTSGLGAFPKTEGLVYSASKAAMRNFTTGLRFALKNQAIKVLEFIPPVTDTAMTAGRNEVKISAEKLVEQILPQLQKERKRVTIAKMRVFLWIAFLFPKLAHKILS